MNDFPLAGSPSSDRQLIARNGLIYLFDVDWGNLQAAYINTNVSATYWKYDPCDIFAQNPLEGAAELYILQQDIAFELNLGNYFLNLKSDSIELLVDGSEPVSVLGPEITWNGRVLSGVLNNWF